MARGRGPAPSRTTVFEIRKSRRRTFLRSSTIVGDYIRKCICAYFIERKMSDGSVVRGIEIVRKKKKEKSRRETIMRNERRFRRRFKIPPFILNRIKVVYVIYFTGRLSRMFMRRITTLPTTRRTDFMYFVNKKLFSQ